MELVPKVTQVYRCNLIDSRRWRSYKPRRGDVVISTYPKSGTTWMLNIAVNLVCPEALAENPLWKLSPRLERSRLPVEEVIASLDAQKHRRVIKAHLPLDVMPWFPEVKYIVVGRDLRDVGISLWNFYGKLSDEILNNGDPSVPDTFDRFWEQWTTKGLYEGENDGFPFQSSTHFLRSWWEFRSLPNVLFVHYDNLLSDPKREISRVAAYLDACVDEERISQIAAKTSFSQMKQNAAQMFRAESMKDGSETFFHSGRSGQWRDALSVEQVQLYRRMVTEGLPSDCLSWLETGRPIEDK